MSPRKKGTVTLSRGMLHVQCATAKDARVALAQLVNEALEGSYAPHLIELWGHQVLVYRDPSGWRYAVTRPVTARDAVNDELRNTVGTVIHLGDGDERQAIKYAVSHLAQQAFTDGDHTDYDRAMKLLQDSGLQGSAGEDLRGWLGWQVSFAIGKELGLDDEAARRRADKQGQQEQQSS